MTMVGADSDRRLVLAALDDVASLELARLVALSDGDEDDDDTDDGDYEHAKLACSGLMQP